MIRKTVKDTGKSGDTSYGLVESIRNGLTTVIMVGSSRRMTNLRTVDSDIEVGEMVIIDQRTPGMPFVRKLVSPVEDAPRDLAPAVPKPFAGGGGTYGFSINRTGAAYSVGQGWTEIEFDNVLFDDADMFPGTGSRVTLPISGVYLLMAQIAFKGTTRYTPPADPMLAPTYTHTDRVNLHKQPDADQFLFQIVGSSFGIVVENQGFPIDADPINIASVTSTQGLIVAQAGEEVYVKMYVDHSGGPITIAVSSGGVYPKFSGYRMNRIVYDDSATAGILENL